MPIEQLSPGLERLLDVDQEVEMVGDYGADAGAFEGPVWWKEGGYVLFSDIFHDRMMRWAPADGVTVFREPSNSSNGLTRDLKGRLLICEHETRRVTRLEDDGSITVVVDRYQGKLLNRPNDVVVKSDGSIYFTDPRSGNVQSELGFAGVFRVSPDMSTITLLADDFPFPNGLAFSPDESVLYVDDSYDNGLRSFNVNPDGTLAGGGTFCDMARNGRGGSGGNGMKVDVEGNIYCVGPGGVWIIGPDGRCLGNVVCQDDNHATNVCWGDEDMKSLYITLFRNLARIRVKIPGVPMPG